MCICFPEPENRSSLCFKEWPAAMVCTIWSHMIQETKWGHFLSWTPCFGDTITTCFFDNYTVLKQDGTEQKNETEKTIILLWKVNKVACQIVSFDKWQGFRKGFPEHYKTFTLHVRAMFGCGGCVIITQNVPLEGGVWTEKGWERYNLSVGHRLLMDIFCACLLSS